VAATATGGNGAIAQAQMVGAVADGMRALVQAGLAQHVGFNGLGDVEALGAIARSGRYATVQTYFNVLNPSAGYADAAGGGQDFAGLIDVAAGAGVGVIAIRVLAAGALGGTPERHPNAGNPGMPVAGGAEYARDLARARRLAPLVGELGLESPYELALRFALAKPGVSTALVGFSDLAQLEAALRWAERGPLPSDAVQRIVALARGAAD
jgi:aryl-alcohol dehydrogenase-like predicted oxidoreductase